MSSSTGPESGLPVRMPRPRQPGRHRRPEPLVAPEGAPALVLAVPGVPSAATRGLAEEVVSIARSELPGLNARIGYLDGDDAEFPSLRSVLAHAAEEVTGGHGDNHQPVESCIVTKAIKGSMDQAAISGLELEHTWQRFVVAGEDALLHHTVSGFEQRMVAALGVEAATAAVGKGNNVATGGRGDEIAVRFDDERDSVG